ncbi:uncharacterized protein LOC141912952 [Tubulanus polymorphus]|uniref:uncharacterized protein LOC141912952 n=1 Tax=Tubulanus polymorphus TaxID=672921 RepID=UPI003DA6B98E
MYSLSLSLTMVGLVSWLGGSSAVSPSFIVCKNCACEPSSVSGLGDMIGYNQPDGSQCFCNCGKAEDDSCSSDGACIVGYVCRGDAAYGRHGVCKSKQSILI